MATTSKTQTNTFLFIIIIIAIIIGLGINSVAKAPAPVVPEISPVVKTKTVVPAKTAVPVTIQASVTPTATPKVAPTIKATVVSPSTPNTLTLTGPNGGDFWKRNVSKAITWQQSGLDKVWITLDIICTPGFTCNKSAPLNGHYTIAKDVPAASGSYVWTTGTTIECGKGETEACPFRNANYTMKICSADGVLCSQKDFTVTL